MSNLLCTGAMCMNITNNYVSLHRASTCEITPLATKDIIYFDIDLFRNVALSHKMDKMQRFM